MTFEVSPKLTKQIDKYTDKHPTFLESLEELKNLLDKHFDQNNPFVFSKKMLVIDPKIKYRTTYKVLGVQVDGLRSTQCPRLWFRLENNKVIFLLFMDDHIKNYNEASAVKAVEQIMKEMEL